jgi:hypothetical protein
LDEAPLRDNIRAGLMMRFVNFLAVTAVLSLVLAAQGHAQDVMVYPAQGQSQEQQQRDGDRSIYVDQL